jgi:rhodanese-related sulfurtransferase
LSFKNATPSETFQALKNNPDALYLDVRTEQEFAQGHPAGALNVPVLFFEAQGGSPRPNDDFLQVVSRHVDAGREVFVGCQSGARSQRAADILVGAGYSSVTNVLGGFGGQRDRAGNVLAAGWRDSGLPVESGAPQGRTYRELRAEAAT